MIEIITGNFLDAKEKYIAHSCNSISNNSAGIAKTIFDKFPYSNTYIKRVKLENGKNSHIDTPSTIDIMGNGLDQRYIINMYSLYYPGKPKYPDSTLDGVLARQGYFYKCLLRVAKIPNLESVAFPWRISCNLGGGDWEWHLGMIKIFGQHINETQNAKVFIYRKNGDE